MAGAGDIEQQEFGLDLSDRAVILDHRPVHRDGRQTPCQTAEQGQHDTGKASPSHAQIPAYHS